MLKKTTIFLILCLLLQTCITSDHGNSSHQKNNSTHDTNHTDHHHHEHHGIHVASFNFEYVKKPLILSIFLIVVVFAKIGFHHANFLSNWMPESCILIILGIVVGAILHLTNADITDFHYIEPRTFFLFLLPPCILEAAYGLHDQVFFQNLGTIIVYALLGTLLNCFIVGTCLYILAFIGAMGPISMPIIQFFVFSSLIVAVDPVAVLAIFQEIGVNNVLYFLVFGESLLNDAVTVVLYNTITTLSKLEGSIPASEILLAMVAFITVSLGGLCIGLVFGVLSSLVTKYTIHVKMMETLAMLILAYASYLTAELFHFSGIISMIGCGLIQMQYAFHNISANSSITIKNFTKMLSGACDCIIFMFLGITVFKNKLKWHAGFVLWVVILCLAIRFAVTYGLTYILNKMDRKRRIGTKEQFIMAYGGLRGAVAFCLVELLDESEHKDLFRTATLVIIFFTVFIQGITIKPLVKCLKIEGEEVKTVSLYQEINSHVMDHLLQYMEEVLGNYGYNRIQGWITNMDDKYLKKILMREPCTKDEIIMELYQQIALQQHYESIYGVDSSQTQLYRPELIKKPSLAFENNALSLQVEQLQQNICRRERKISEESKPGLKFFDVVKAVRPKTTTNAFMRSESVTPTPSSKWKVAGRLAGVRKSMMPTVSHETLELRKLLNMSSTNDMFARHSNRNLMDGDKTDLLQLLNEKQQRHNRFKAGLSQSSTPGLSRAQSIDSSNHNHENRQEVLNKHKTVDFDSRPANKYVTRFISKRPVHKPTSPPSVTHETVPLMPLKEEPERSVDTKPSTPHSHSAPQTPAKAPFKSIQSFSAQQSPTHVVHSAQADETVSSEVLKDQLEKLEESGTASLKIDKNNFEAQKRSSFKRQDAGDH